MAEEKKPAGNKKSTASRKASATKKNTGGRGKSPGTGGSAGRKAGNTSKKKPAAPGRKKSAAKSTTSTEKKTATTRKKTSTSAAKSRQPRQSRKKKSNTDPVIITTNEEEPTSEKEMAYLFGHEQVDSVESQSTEERAQPAEIKPETVSKSRVKNSRLRAVLKTVAVLFIILVAGIYFYLAGKFQNSVPKVSGQISNAVISSPLTIKRDEMGVPYIKAENEKDLYFGIGYAMAQDRLWQMNAIKMVASGRMAEVAGREFLPVDIYMRLVGIKRYSDKTYKQIPAEIREMMQMFAEGVNAYVENAEELPPEFFLTGYKPEKWQPVDSLYVFSFFNLMLAGNHIEELAWLNLAAATGPEKAAWLNPVYADEPIPFKEASKLKNIDFKKLMTYNSGLNKKLQEVFKVFQPSLPASNNWVLSPQKTSTGRALLANDTHLQLTVPSAWMFIQVECPEYTASGLTLPGVPLVSIGYNGHIGWGITMAMGDNQDIFIEKLRTRNGKTEYLADGRWFEVYEKPAEFKIKGGETVTKTFQFTRHGALLNTALQNLPDDSMVPANIKASYGLAHRTSIADSEKTPFGFYSLLKARDMKSARTAMKKIDGIYLNIVYSDGENIGWQVTGKYPLRKKGRGKLPSPGWVSTYDWQGYLDYEENPYAINPETGFVGTANHRTTADDYEHIISSSWYSPERAERIYSILKENRKFSTDDMHEMQLDLFSEMSAKTADVIFNSEFQSQLMKSAEKMPDNRQKLLSEALTILKNFDHQIRAGSKGAALINVFYHKLTENTFADELQGKDSLYWQSFTDINLRQYHAPQDHILGREQSPFWDDTTSAEKETKTDIFARSLVDSMLYLQNTMGHNREMWEWGKIHTYTWQHEFSKKAGFLKYLLDRGPYAGGGDLHTIRVAGTIHSEDFNIRVIPAMRMVIDFSQKEPLYLINNMGQSGNPASQHYDDFIPYFLEGRTRKQAVTSGSALLKGASLLKITPGQ